MPASYRVRPTRPMTTVENSSALKLKGVQAQLSTRQTMGCFIYLRAKDLNSGAHRVTSDDVAASCPFSDKSMVFSSTICENIRAGLADLFGII